MRSHLLLLILGLGSFSLTWADPAQDSLAHGNNGQPAFNNATPPSSAGQADAFGAAPGAAARLNMSQQDIFEQNNNWHVRFGNRP
jgi:uncharacterized protein (DUF1800 family)